MPALTQHWDSLTAGKGVRANGWICYIQCMGRKKPAKSTVLRWESQALARQIELELSGEQA